MKNIVTIIFFIVIVLLQIYLSKKESKGLGLILPSSAFLYSLSVIRSFLIHNSTRNPDYVVISEVVFFSITSFILTNIPTVILLLINFHYSKKKKAVKELDKMNIQDLN